MENISWFYKAYKSYIRFMVNTLYYKDVHIIDKENVPEAGKPLLIVADHQNSLNDALGIMLSLDDRKVHFIARADIFHVHPIITKFLYSIGLLPAFRIAFEGEEALHGNDTTFAVSEQRLLDGKTVALYPEAGHQDHHWLGKFTYGYTRMAFEAAERGNFEKEIFILPSCNHYSEYQGLRNSMLIRYGKPISLAPYYELYKTKPRTAQRQVNALVREQIKDMMLNVEDQENYKSIDFLRVGKFGDTWAKDHDFRADYLPSKLESDKTLVAAIEKNREKAQPVLDRVSSLIGKMESAKVTEKEILDPPTWFEILEDGLLLLLLAPLAIFFLWPFLPCWLIPRHFIKKLGDRMLEGTFVIALNVLLIVPICAIISLIVFWSLGSPLRGVAYALLTPFTCLFEWAYYKIAVRFLRNIRYRKAMRSGLAAQMESEYSDILSDMDKALSE